MQKINIKNMVCNRCIEAVSQLLDELSIPYSAIQLGEVTLKKAISNSQKSTLAQQLRDRGFELLEDKNSKIIERIKTLILSTVRESTPLKTNYSDYLESEINIDYGQLSTIFSSVEGLTIERYIILQKLELVKELLVYNELTLGEIADQAGYSSVHHLSNQFKKNIGMAPTQFKKLHTPNRTPLDKI